MTTSIKTFLAVVAVSLICGVASAQYKMDWKQHCKFQQQAPLEEL